MEHEIDVWNGAYPSNWNGKIVKEAMSHPAKYSSRLIKKIYDHILAEGWAKAGDSVIDPFGGVALGALDAMRLGLNWQGVELEPKFHEIGNANIDLWMRKFGQLPRWGTAQLHCGDSRKLLEVIGNAQVAVSSPPYADSIDSKHNGIDWTKVTKDYPGRKMHDKRIAMNDKRHSEYNYGETPGQLGSMPANGFEIAISSPPFLQSDGGAAIPSKYRDDPTFMARHAAGNKSSDAYGTTEGQLSSMKEGGFDVAVSSPPFEDSLSRDGVSAEDRRTLARSMGISNAEHISPIDMERIGKRDQTYGVSAGQLGSESGDDFWLASRSIVEQVYLALVPGGHAIWVVKDYVKNKQIVPFCDQWRQLCEAVGFVTLHEHHASLIRNVKKQYNLEGGLTETRSESKSFFRRLYEKKGGHRIDYECVLCMEKPA